MNNRFLTAVLVIVLAGFALVIYRQEQLISTLAERQAAPSPAPVQGAQPGPKPVPALSNVDFTLDMTGVPVRGAKASGVVFLEFSDFQCPFCGRYVRDTLPRIDADYVGSGKAQYAFRQFPLESLHPNAKNAAMAATCAGAQGKFWELHDRLFANQTQLELPKLITYGSALGMDESKYKTCLEGQATQSQVQHDRDDAISFGFTGTPAFLVGRLDASGRFHATRRISGAQPYSVFQAALDDVIGGK